MKTQTEIKLEKEIERLDKKLAVGIFQGGNDYNYFEGRLNIEKAKLFGYLLGKLESKEAFEDLIDKRIKECERREMSCDAGMQYNAKLWRVEINSLKKLKEGLKSI